MNIEQRAKRERKYSPVFWKDERIGVDEVRMYPPGYRFSSKEPIPTHYQNMELFLRQPTILLRQLPIQQESSRLTT